MQIQNRKSCKLSMSAKRVHVVEIESLKRRLKPFHQNKVEKKETAMMIFHQDSRLKNCQRFWDQHRNDFYKNVIEAKESRIDRKSRLRLKQFKVDFDKTKEIVF